MIPEQLYKFACDHLHLAYKDVAAFFDVPTTTAVKAIQKIDPNFIKKRERFLKLKSFVICTYKKQHPKATIEDFMREFPYPEEFIRAALRLQGLKPYFPRPELRGRTFKPKLPPRMGVNLKDPDAQWAAAGLNFANGGDYA